MRNRFLFVNREGREVEVASEEALARHIEAGDLGEETLLYDSITREWAPVRVHPVGASLLAAVEEALAGPMVNPPPPATGPGPTATPEAAPVAGDASAVAPPEASTGEAAAAPVDPVVDVVDPVEDDGFLGLDLVPEDESHAEEMVQDFMASREAELEEERRLRGAEAENLDVPLVDEGQETVAPATPVRQGLAVARGPLATGSGPRGAARGGDDPSAHRSRGQGRARGGRGGAEVAGMPPRAGDDRPERSSALRQVALLAGLIVVGGLGIRDAVTSPVPPPDPGEAVLEFTPPRPAGPLAAPGALAVVSAAAMRDMGAALEDLRAEMGVNQPPSVWLSGAYLSDASVYPEVSVYWDRYGDLVSAMRDAEEDLFREGVTQRLEAEGQVGSALEIRVARALQDFRADRSRRAAEYDAMEALATAAVEMDAFLRRSARSIEYVPAEAGLALDPALEVSIRSEIVRRELAGRLDDLLDALDRVAGPDPDRRRDVTRHILGRVSTPPPSPVVVDSTPVSSPTLSGTGPATTPPAMGGTTSSPSVVDTLPPASPIPGVPDSVPVPTLDPAVLHTAGIPPDTVVGGR
jgi:hypothetical protein